MNQSRLALSVAVVIAINTSVLAQTWQRVTIGGPPGAGMALLMTDGTVIIHNADAREWYKLTPNNVGSYVNGTWSQIASFPPAYGPLYYGGAVLADGRAVITGGEYNFGSAVWTNQSAWYNPVTNVWTMIAPPAGWANIGDAQCCVMPDGKFMLAQILDARMAILNPATMTFSPVTSIGHADRFDEEGWTLLPDGTIFTVDAIAAPRAERYIPSTGNWIFAGNTPATLVDAGSQEIGPSVLLPSGRVFNMGATMSTATWTPGAGLMDPGSWVAGPNFPIVGGQLVMADAPACLLPSGNVLLGASPGVFATPTWFYEYNGTSFINSPETPNSGGNPCYVGNMLMLPTGQVLYTDFSNDIEIYTPTGSPNNAWRPTITNCPSTLNPGQTFLITGTQFNGVSQCSAYGDDSTNATNYPIVRVTNTASGHVFYCKTSNHSTMAVATGATPVSTTVLIPAGIETGPSNLVVVANGIASTNCPVDIERPASLSGHVDLELLSVSPLNQPVVIEFRPPGNPVPVATYNVTLNALGNYSVASVLNGTYDIAAKGTNWLRQKLGSVVVNGATGANFSLTNGDGEVNNAVDLGDLNRCLVDFATVGVDPADLDKDLVVGVPDLNIVLTNFAIVGDA